MPAVASFTHYSHLYTDIAQCSSSLFKLVALCCHKSTHLIMENHDPQNPLASFTWDDGAYSTIRRIVVYEKEWICSIQIEYDGNGESIMSETHGENEGSMSEVVFEYPDEFLVSISGYYGSIRNWGVDRIVIRSLTFESNGRYYGPFGIQEGKYFKSPGTEGKIIGFHGISDPYLNAIGVHVQTVQKLGIQPEPPKPLNMGQYGGKGGNPWKETFETIKRVRIYHGLWIDSFQIQYEEVDEMGTLVWTEIYGGEGGFLATVDLEFDEYFISVEGYYSDLQKWGMDATVIRSLTLKTNQNTYGPFGIEDGTKFSFPFKGLKLVGFHGRSGVYLDAIGLYLRPTPINGTEKFSLGECGGEGGDPWDENFTTIRKLVINHGQWIDSIQMEYEDENGEVVLSEKHGGNGGSESEVVLNFPDEHIVTIRGYYDNLRDWGLDTIVIQSLTVETNTTSYGPFGVENGTKFSFPSDGVKVVGIHGRSGLYLDAIGLMAVPVED